MHHPFNPPAAASFVAVAPRHLVLAHAVLIALVLLPVLFVEIPGLGDYLNHLARMHVLAEYDQSPQLQSLYGFNDKIRPYLAMDLIVPNLARFMSIYDAGRVFIALAMLAPVLGAVALHRAAWGTAGVMPVLAYLFAYNRLLSWGFLNYLFACGLALLLLAAWLRTADWPRWRRVPVFAVAATVVFFCHLLAFGAYCLAVAGIECARAWRAGPGAWRTTMRDWCAAAAQAVPAALVLLHLDLQHFTVAPALTAFGDIQARLIAFASPFTFVGGRIDSLCQAALAAIIGYALLRRRVRVAPALWPAAAVLLVLALLMPEWIDGTWGMHLRLPLVGVLVLLAALSLRLTPREQIALLAGVAALVMVRSVIATRDLHRAGRDIGEMRTMVATIPEGARVLVAMARLPQAVHRYGPWRMTAQMAMVALIERDVFIPCLFSGVPVVRPVDALVPLSTPHGHPLSRRTLEEGIIARDGPGMPEGDGHGRRIYWRDWPRKFSYVIWQHYGAPDLDFPALLEPIARGRSTTIYRVRTPPGAG